MMWWTKVRLAWHTGRIMRHEQLQERMQIKLGICLDCGGSDGKHQLNCGIWPHNVGKE